MAQFEMSQVARVALRYVRCVRVRVGGARRAPDCGPHGSHPARAPRVAYALGSVSSEALEVPDKRAGRTLSAAGRLVCGHAGRVASERAVTPCAIAKGEQCGDGMRRLVAYAARRGS